MATDCYTFQLCCYSWSTPACRPCAGVSAGHSRNHLETFWKETFLWNWNIQGYVLKSINRNLLSRCWWSPKSPFPGPQSQLSQAALAEALWALSCHTWVFHRRKPSLLGVEEQSNEGKKAHEIFMKKNAFQILLFPLSKKKKSPAIVGFKSPSQWQGSTAQVHETSLISSYNILNVKSSTNHDKWGFFLHLYLSM